MGKFHTWEKVSVSLLLFFSALCVPDQLGGDQRGLAHSVHQEVRPFCPLEAGLFDLLEVAALKLDQLSFQGNLVHRWFFQLGGFSGTLTERTEVFSAPCDITKGWLSELCMFSGKKKEAGEENSAGPSKSLVCVCVSMESWVSAEDDVEERDWPELLSDTSAVGGAGHSIGLPRLKRGQGSRHLGVDMAFNPDSEEGAELGNKCFTSSGGGANAAGGFFIAQSIVS